MSHLHSRRRPKHQALSADGLFANAVLLAAIWYLLLPSPALAYFDLGFGTYMMQLIFGFGAAAFLALRSSLQRKFKGWMKKEPKLSEEEQSGD